MIYNLPRFFKAVGKESIFRKAPLKVYSNLKRLAQERKSLDHSQEKV